LALESCLNSFIEVRKNHESEVVENRFKVFVDVMKVLHEKQKELFMKQFKK
jgi:hypothetical protein